MKNYINIFGLFAYASLLQGCIDGAYDKKLNAGYYLSAIDIKENMLVGFQDGDYGIGIIRPTVFAVGQNDEFIIAKQHPKLVSGGINKRITNYFIISLKNKINKLTKKNMYGPLTKEEFEQKRKELNIESLDFTIIFNELE